MPQRKGSPVDEDGLTTGVTEDTRRLSHRPSAVRQRIRRNGGRAAEDIALLHEIQYGESKPVSEWTLEELQHGRPRHPTGGWKGPRPKWITPIIQAEIRKRLREETIGKLVGHTGKAIKVLAEFLDNEEEPNLRFKAAQLIIQYAAGEPEKQVTLSGNIQLQHMLASALVMPDGQPAHPVIEGTLVNTDQGDDEEDEDDDA